MSLSADIEAAERRLADRRLALRARHARFRARLRERLSSPAVSIAAAGLGFLLATRRGRRGLARLFSGVQLALAVLSAARG